MVENKKNILADENNIRIDTWLAKKIKGYSRTYIQKLINDNMVLVNSNPIKSNYKIKPKDKISIAIPIKKTVKIMPEDIKLDIIYEDDSILIINKPKGMVVHPASGNYEETLVNALINYCGKNLSDIGGTDRPGIVHRLDKDTSGALIVAKNNQVHKFLAKEFKLKKIKRIYVSVVKGIIKEDTGKILLPVGRHPINRKKMAVNKEKGKEAITYFKVIERFVNNTYVELRLETGRTHQIRVHMSYIGYPVIGDLVYGNKNKNLGYKIKGQALHAKILGFNHPVTGKYMEFEAPLPKDFKSLLEHEMSKNAVDNKC